MSEPRTSASWTAIEAVEDRCRDRPQWSALRTAVRAHVVAAGGEVSEWTRGKSIAGSTEAIAPASAEIVLGYADGPLAFDAVGRVRGVQSLVLVRCEVSPDDRDLIAESPEMAVLTVADPSDRDRLVGAIEGHLVSPHESSDVVVGPFDPASAAAAIGSWLDERRQVAVSVEEITITTPDGWVLGADLHLPSSGAVAPAVVLMHTGRSDRIVFDRLAGLLARRGVAALALDWRGRGVSSNLGRFVDFTSEQQQTVRRDVTASFDFLESRPEVDGRRLGVLGIAHGAGYGADGALGDDRTRALGMMTAYHLLDDRQRRELESGSVAVLCVGCTPNALSAGAMRDIHATSTNRRSRLIEYPEGVLGYQLFDLHPDLEPTIAHWFAEVLAP